MVKLTCLLVLAAALVTPAASASPTGNNDHVITAIGIRKAGPAWLSVYGPAFDGTYSARIDVSDLDLKQQAGRQTVVSRVRRGVHDLCNVAVYAPGRMQQVYRPERAAINCFHDTYESAKPQMTTMLAAIDGGAPVSRLAFVVTRAGRAR